MALMYCPECGDVVSSQARSCPHCGCPYDAPPPSTGSEPDHVGFVAYQAPPPPSPARRRVRVQTVELTSKFWRGQQLLAALLAIGGVIGAGVSANEKTMEWLGPWSGLAIIAGMLWFAAARIGAWWHHG